MALPERYDVIVAGGGASGMIAAVAAAKRGARTLLLERQGCLGGVATSAYVAQYVGFFNNDLQAVWGLPYDLVCRIEAAGGTPGFGSYTMGEAAATPVTIYNLPFNPEIVKIVADEFVEDAGVDTLLHCQTVGVVNEGEHVSGVEVETLGGKRTFEAGAVVDATGDATLAHHAGVAMQPDNAEAARRQPASLVFRLSNVDVPRFRAIPRDEKRAMVLEGIDNGELFWESLSFVSTPGGFDAICLMSRIRGYDVLDPVGAAEAEREGRRQIKSIVSFLNRKVPGFEKAILANIASRLGVRETRRILGRHTLTAEEILSETTFEDAIALGCGPMDVHDPDGMGIALSMPDAPWQIPLRCLVPESVEGLLVTGRAVSATQEANGGSRHMATAMALGQAAGVAAATAVDIANSTLAIPAGPVRAALREQGAALDVEDCRRLADAHAGDPVRRSLSA